MGECVSSQHEIPLYCLSKLVHFVTPFCFIFYIKEKIVNTPNPEDHYCVSFQSACIRIQLV